MHIMKYCNVHAVARYVAMFMYIHAYGGCVASLLLHLLPYSYVCEAIIYVYTGTLFHHAYM